MDIYQIYTSTLITVEASDLTTKLSMSEFEKILLDSNIQDQLFVNKTFPDT